MDQIGDWFVEELGFTTDDFSSMKICKYKDEKSGEWLQTPRTIVLVSENLFWEVAGWKSRETPRIAPFELRGERSLPNPNEMQTKNLFFRVPPYPEVRTSILEMIKPLVTFGVLGASDYQLVMKTPNRERNSKSLYNCFIVFNDSVPETTAALVKVVLDGAVWYPDPKSEEPRHFSCKWAKSRGFYKKETTA